MVWGSSEIGLMTHGQDAASEAIADRAGGAAAGKPLQGLGPGPGGAVGAVGAGDAVHVAVLHRVTGSR